MAIGLVVVNKLYIFSRIIEWCRVSSSGGCPVLCTLAYLIKKILLRRNLVKRKKKILYLLDLLVLVVILLVVTNLII
jgi:hypothetical protein